MVICNTTQSLKTIMLVFTNYCPNEHYLGFIQKDIEDFYPEINNFFKREETIQSSLEFGFTRTQSIL